MNLDPVASEFNEELLDRLVDRLSRPAPLSARAVDRLRAVPVTIRDAPARTLIHVAEEPLETSCFVMEGFAAKFTLMKSGEMPISAVQIRGDFPGLLTLLLPFPDFSLQTLTPCRLAFFDRTALKEAAVNAPELAEALWRETLVDAAIFRTATLRVGQLPAVGRVAHFLCETRLRLGANRHTDDADEFILDLTQQDLGDALALSFVSINRSLKELRTRHYVEVDRPMVRIRNWIGLQRIGQFNPAYLHLSPAA